jgi:N-formylglutamate amidohydrolase
VKVQLVVKRIFFIAFCVLWFDGIGVSGLGQSPVQSADQRPLAQRKLEELVIVCEGELPILISAPHGGTQSIAGVEPREGKGMETGPKGFFTGRDGGTQELAEEVVVAIGKKFGKKPFAVISATHRKYLDPNRPPSIAYEDVDAKPVYDRYHDAMSRFAKQIMNERKHGLLLDIHGQGTSRETVYRGTSNGKTVERLKQRFGEQAHLGEQSLFGLLKKQGWKVYPDPFDEREKSGFTGGFIVQTYGSHNAIGIDAVQLELGAEYRTTGAREKIATQIADAVFEYSQLYLSSRTLGN